MYKQDNYSNKNVFFNIFPRLFMNINSFLRLAAVILFAALFLFPANLCAREKIKPADYAYSAFHYKMAMRFIVSEKATNEIILRRNVPGNSEHQAVKNEKLFCSRIGSLSIIANKFNRYIEYKTTKKEYLEYCSKNSIKPDDTVEILYECDYIGYKTFELDEGKKYPFGFYKVKNDVALALKNKIMAVLENVQVPDYSKEVELTGQFNANLEKLFAYINKKVVYTRQKQGRNVLATLNGMSGNCISKTNLWRAMTGIMGLKSFNVTCVIMSKKNKNVTHRMTVNKIGTKGVPFCPTNKHFAILPAHYMVLSFFKKDNYLKGVRNFRFEFEITPVKRGMDVAEIEDEFLGEEQNVLETENLDEY